MMFQYIQYGNFGVRFNVHTPPMSQASLQDSTITCPHSLVSLKLFQNSHTIERPAKVKDDAHFRKTLLRLTGLVGRTVALARHRWCRFLLAGHQGGTGLRNHPEIPALDEWPCVPTV